MTGIPEDLSSSSADQLHHLSADDLEELERRAGAATLVDDRVTGQRWPRDTVARFWPCKPESVSQIMTRRRVTRVGFDDATGQATYRAEEVVAAKHEAPRQGERTDIRDRSLAETTDVGYLWGRLLAAYEVVNRQWFTVVPTAEPRTTAVEAILANGGYCPPGLRVRLEEDYARALKRNRSHPVSGPRGETVQAIIAELTPLVDQHLHGRRLTQDEEFLMGIGFHHQRGALYELPNKQS